MGHPIIKLSLKRTTEFYESFGEINWHVKPCLQRFIHYKISVLLVEAMLKLCPLKEFRPIISKLI